MTAKEARQQQWQNLKDKPLKDKLKYIFTYYWAAIIGGVCVLACAISMITGALTKKDIALSGYLVNSYNNTSYTQDFRQEFLAHQQLDPKKYDFSLISNVSYSKTNPSEAAFHVMESIMIQSTAGNLDFVVVDLTSYPVFSAYYTDLRSVLTDEQLEKWSSQLIYVEKEALDILTSDDVDNIRLPDYFLSAEGLKDPIPMGIRIPTSSCLFEAYSFPNDEIVIGIMRNTPNLENTLAFIEYIMN